MVLWRISRHGDLSGGGGLRVPGRWHFAGRPVVYLASTPSAALLEICVHTSANDVPADFTLLKVVGADVAVTEIRMEDLREDWAGHLEVTRRIGSEWLLRRETALLQIPSVIVPETFNFMLNPLHADAAKLAIERSYSYPFDSRLKK